MTAVGESPPVEEVPAEVPGEGPDPVRAELAALRGVVEELRDAGARADARAEARERVIDHQREEIDRLRAEQRGGHLRPLVVDLQRLRAELLADGESGRYYADSVLAVLEGQGCGPLAPAVDDEFVAAEHRVARTVTVGPEQHGRILEVLAEGWVEHATGRVLAPAKVVVGRYREETG